jgi:anaerobic ribonucleoside-triphosphate reductase activating protein
MKITLAGITQESVTDGPGMRITVFFQGCEHHCPGCHNPQTWDRAGGTTYEIDDVFGLIKDSPLIRGITLSGGEPLLQPAAALSLVSEFKSRGKDAWVFTGFRWEDLLKKDDPVLMDLIQQCDVLVDGPFKQAERKPGLYFRGSANQRIIAVKESLQQGKIIEWEESRN